MMNRRQALGVALLILVGNLVVKVGVLSNPVAPTVGESLGLAAVPFLLSYATRSD